MKDGIHPKVNKEAVVTCACGNKFTTFSTKDTISVEICSACHPFYTGQQKFVDTEGRIDKFIKKQKIATEKKQAAQDIKKAKDSRATKTVEKAASGQPTLKDLLEQARNQTA